MSSQTSTPNPAKRPENAQTRTIIRRDPLDPQFPWTIIRRTTQEGHTTDQRIAAYQTHQKAMVMAHTITHYITNTTPTRNLGTYLGQTNPNLRRHQRKDTPKRG